MLVSYNSGDGIAVFSYADDGTFTAQFVESGSILTIDHTKRYAIRVFPRGEESVILSDVYVEAQNTSYVLAKATDNSNRIERIEAGNIGILSGAFAILMRN